MLPAARWAAALARASWRALQQCKERCEPPSVECTQAHASAPAHTDSSKAPSACIAAARLSSACVPAPGLLLFPLDGQAPSVQNYHRCHAVGGELLHARHEVADKPASAQARDSGRVSGNGALQRSARAAADAHVDEGRRIAALTCQSTCPRTAPGCSKMRPCGAMSSRPRPPAGRGTC